jgi:hypothetical protein
LVYVHLLSDHRSGNGVYTAATYRDTDTVEVSVLPGCVIDLKEVFPAKAAGL